MNWHPEELAIQSPARRLDDGKIAGPNSVDKQRLIDSTTEPDCAKDDCNEWSDHDQPHPLIRGHLQDRRETALYVRLGRCPRRHADAHRCVPLPDRTAAPARTVPLDARNHLARSFRASEGHQNLVEHDVVKHAVASSPE